MFLHDWKDSGIEGMKSDFGIGDAELEGVTVLLASYTFECYAGEAFVLFERGGKLYEVHGSHCSCYGLSESSYSGDSTTQWQPEETSIDALLHRLDKGQVDVIEGELHQVLDAYSERISI